MMTERLIEQVNQMQEVHRLEQLQRNRAAQERANAQYTEMLQQAHLLMLTLFELNDKLSFSLRQETNDALKKVIALLKAVPYNGLPAQDRLDEAKRALRPVENTIRAEWKRHHVSITENPLRILQIAQAIEPELCQKTIQDLRASAEWITTPNGYKPLYDALGQSKEIIQRIHASDGVIAFLEKMNQGSATIADLNSEVLNWLQDQSLSDKVYLKFGAGKNY